MQWISYGLYGAGLMVPFFTMALILERLRRAARRFGDDARNQEVLYWQRRRDRLSGS